MICYSAVALSELFYLNYSFVFSVVFPSEIPNVHLLCSQFISHPSQNKRLACSLKFQFYCNYLLLASSTEMMSCFFNPSFMSLFVLLHTTRLFSFQSEATHADSGDNHPKSIYMLLPLCGKHKTI